MRKEKARSKTVFVEELPIGVLNKHKKKWEKATRKLISQK